MKNLVISSLVIGATLLAVTPAQATHYVGAHAVSNGTVSVDVTTDGTTGFLAKSNVLSWAFILTGDSGSTLLDSSNSDFTYLSGASFQATSTQLLFDFDNGGGHMQFDDFGRSGFDALCMDSANPVQNTCVGSPPSEVFVTLSDYKVAARSGLFVLGTATPAPEPASWAMMLGGFGLVGGALRSRRRAVTSFA